MFNKFISLIKFRRGKKAQRVTTQFEEGEPLFETDTRRFFIGVGNNDNANVGPSTFGGTLIGNLNFFGPTDYNPTAVTEPRAYEGDIMFANNKLWMYTGTLYTDISTKVDNVRISYNANNELTIHPDAFVFEIIGGDGISVTGTSTVNVKLNDDTGLSINADNELQINFENNGPIFVNAANELTIRPGSIKPEYISTPSWNFDPNYFTVNNTTVSIKSVPLGSKDDTVTLLPDNIAVSSINGGITARFFANEPFITGIGLTDDKNIGITESLVSRDAITDHIIGLKPSVERLLSANNASDSTYNGSISDIYDVSTGDADWTGNARKTITVYDTDIIDEMIPANAITLKSAGFITLKQGSTINGLNYSNLAIPVFELPGPPEVIDITVFGDISTSTSAYMAITNFAGQKCQYIHDNNLYDLVIADYNDDYNSFTNSSYRLIKYNDSGQPFNNEFLELGDTIIINTIGGQTTVKFEPFNNWLEQTKTIKARRYDAKSYRIAMAPGDSSSSYPRPDALQDGYNYVGVLENGDKIQLTCFDSDHQPSGFNDFHSSLQDRQYFTYQAGTIADYSLSNVPVLADLVALELHLTNDKGETAISTYEI